jgi:transcriptional regulator
MRARGLSQIDIARELQVSRAPISSDIQYLIMLKNISKVRYRAMNNAKRDLTTLYTSCNLLH